MLINVTRILRKESIIATFVVLSDGNAYRRNGLRISETAARIYREKNGDKPKPIRRGPINRRARRTS